MKYEEATGTQLPSVAVFVMVWHGRGGGDDRHASNSTQKKSTLLRIFASVCEDPLFGRLSTISTFAAAVFKNKGAQSI